MEKQRICKICNRRFANGKAMGGHMRSHLAKLPVPPKPGNPAQVDSRPVKFLSSSSSLSLHSGREDMQRIYRSKNHQVSDTRDGESETESPRSLTGRRSKRRRKGVVRVVAPPPQAPTMTEPDSVGSVTGNFSDEEIAVCLLMLSRDKWPEEDKRAVVEHFEDEEAEEDDEEEEDEDEDEEEDEDDELFSVRVGNNNDKGKYKCEKCKKIFPSYQALGGHKASHKKMRIHHPSLLQLKPNNNGFEEEDSTSAVGIGGVTRYQSGTGGVGGSFRHQIQRVFRCTFCDKVFESGQALGGHKKVHFSYLSVGVTPKPPPKTGDSLNIDLNLPAPEEDSDVHQKLVIV